MCKYNIRYYNKIDNFMNGRRVVVTSKLGFFFCEHYRYEFSATDTYKHSYLIDEKSFLFKKEFFNLFECDYSSILIMIPLQ